MKAFGPATTAWFSGTFDRPTPVQSRGWERIAAGEHSLLIAPTGSGKTLAAFLWCIDRLSRPRRLWSEGEAIAYGECGTRPDPWQTMFRWPNDDC